jgi:hypothetical protein
MKHPRLCRSLWVMILVLVGCTPVVPELATGTPRPTATALPTATEAPTATLPPRSYVDAGAGRGLLSQS